MAQRFAAHSTEKRTLRWSTGWPVHSPTIQVPAELLPWGTMQTQTSILSPVPCGTAKAANIRQAKPVARKMIVDCALERRASYSVRGRKVMIES